jgi:hypothetical protein
MNLRPSPWIAAVILMGLVGVFLLGFGDYVLRVGGSLMQVALFGAVGFHFDRKVCKRNVSMLDDADRRSAALCQAIVIAAFVVGGCVAV